MPNTLISYIEDYFKKEGLLSFIHPTRRKFVFQSPLLMIIWLSGLTIITVFTTWGFSSPWNTILFNIVSLLSCIGILAFLSTTRNKNINDLTITVVLFLIYPISLLAFVFYKTLAWKYYIFYETILSLVLFIFLFLAVLLEGITQIFTIGWHTFETFIRILGKSLSTIIVVAPLLLVVVILSILSQDIWVILGNNRLDTYWYAIIILTILPTAVSYTQIKGLGLSLMGGLTDNTDVLSNLRKIDFFTTLINSGLISPNELKTIHNDMLWRDRNKAFNTFNSKVQKSLTTRLIIYIEAITLFLIVIFFIYFLLVFILLLPPDEIAEWTGYHLSYSKYKLVFLAGVIHLPSTLDITAKVSFSLSIIISMMARISIINDSSFKEKILYWFTDKSRDWIIASEIYNCLIHPNFQFWKYKVDSPNILNCHIVVRPNLQEEKIKEACYELINLKNSASNLKIVTAFEKEEGREDYDFGTPGKRWQLLINNKTQTEKFSDISLDSKEEIRYSHNLGFECIETNQQIPDDWFGSDKLSIRISKEIWNLDKDHNLIWHPYVNNINDLWDITIYFTKRLSKSKYYKDISMKFLKIAVQGLNKYTNITLRIEFRDSMENLVSIDHFNPTNYLSYKDEYMSKTKYSKL